MSNLTRNVDRLTEKMERLEEYTYENNKVINSILHRLDDHAEKFDKTLDEMIADRKLRDAQFEFTLKKFEKLESR